MRNMAINQSKKDRCRSDKLDHYRTASSSCSKFVFIIICRIDDIVTFPTVLSDVCRKQSLNNI